MSHELGFGVWDLGPGVSTVFLGFRLGVATASTPQPPIVGLHQSCLGGDREYACETGFRVSVYGYLPNWCTYTPNRIESP